MSNQSDDIEIRKKPGKMVRFLQFVVGFFAILIVVSMFATEPEDVKESNADVAVEGDDNSAGRQVEDVNDARLVSVQERLEEEKPVEADEPTKPSKSEFIPTITDKAKHELAYGFCYSISALGSCDFAMRFDVEEKVEAMIGQEVRPRRADNPYSESCFDGMLQANNDDVNGTLCSNAWERYGCQGSVVARLLQDSPFKNPNGEFCQF